ncbi:MAG: class I SAM-dependent methyltransferase [Nanoarchaeota archaeon]
MAKRIKPGAAVDPIKVNAEAYNRLAIDYRTRTGSIDIAYPFDDFAKMLPVKRVMDVGCGPGRDVLTILQKGHQVVGVDISAEMLRLGRERVAQFLKELKDSGGFLRERGYTEKSIDDVLGAMFHHAAMENFPIGRPGFEKGSYGGLWAVTSVQHVQRTQLPAFLSQASELLVPKGVMYVKTRAPFDNHPEDLLECLETSSENQGQTFTRFFTYHKPEHLLNSLEEANFSVMRTSKGADGRIQYPSTNSGEQGYKFWIIAKKK